MLRKILKFFLYAIVAGLALGFFLFEPVSHAPYQQQNYYHRTIANLDSIRHQLNPSRGDTLQAGWSRQNITPADPVRLMGYGLKGDYERVHDSLYVRAIVFSDGLQKIAFVSYDLMMVHPAVVQAVQQAIDAASLGVDHMYFTAVHTHNGYGEWATGLSGKVIAGGYNPALVQRIAAKTQQAVREAVVTLAPVAIGYRQYALPSLLANRLVKNGKVDALLRVVALRKKTGETGLICTFAAHGTYISYKSKDLSADYPGALVKQLEADSSVNFALFAAGAVGSHSPVKRSTFSYDKMEHYAAQLARPVLNSVDSFSLAYSRKLLYLSLPVALGEPQLRLSEHWRVRPWLFHVFFGKLHPAITLLQAGEVVFLGFPADFSGMLYPDLKVLSGLHVVATSFNGDYIGYIIPDAYYNKKHSETREMNWFGPYTGSYFTDVSNQLLHLVDKP